MVFIFHFLDREIRLIFGLSQVFFNFGSYFHFKKRLACGAKASTSSIRLFPFVV